MIKVNIHIENPLRKEKWKSLLERSYNVSKNKALEIQFFRYYYYLFIFELDLAWRGSDHAGPRFEFGFLGLNFMINLYDKRHWNHFENTWEIYD
jgi:hypothetical protein